MTIEKKPLMVVSRAVRSMMAAELLAPSTQSKKHAICCRCHKDLGSISDVRKQNQLH